MKLEFKENDLGYQIWEDGKDTDKVKFEYIGMIAKETKALIIHEDYSGILGFEEIEQIYNFMKDNFA